MIKSSPVKIDKDVSGLNWEVANFQELAKIVAVIAVGQVVHAARILDQLEQNAPVISIPQLNEAACEQLIIKSGLNPEQEKAARAHRDGFLFECISWIATRQGADDRVFQKDPHISATSQGLDGLVVELEPMKAQIKTVTICEDKCTDYPRDKFRDEVMPAFTEHHGNKVRGRELLATAVDIIKSKFTNDTEALLAAQRVMELDCRYYRAALTVDATIVTPEKRAKLFKGYNGLAGIEQSQRIGATFVMSGDLRTWFQQLADAVIAAIKSGKVKSV